MTEVLYGATPSYLPGHVGKQAMDPVVTTIVPFVQITVRSVD